MLESGMGGDQEALNSLGNALDADERVAIDRGYLGEMPTAAKPSALQEKVDLLSKYMSQEEAVKSAAGYEDPNALGSNIAEYKSVIQNPDGSSYGINSLTGNYELIPKPGSGPQTNAQFDSMNKLINSARGDKRIQKFIDTSTSYDVVSSTSPNAAGDVSLVYAYMKMLDPGSTVMAGEQALARNAAGVPDRIRTTYNTLLSGQTLGPSQRAEFKAEALKILKNSESSARKAVAPFVKRARANNLRPETINEVIFGIVEPNEGGAPTNEVVPPDFSAMSKQELEEWIAENG